METKMSLKDLRKIRNDVIGNLISEDDQKRKLEVVVETARQVWG